MTTPEETARRFIRRHWVNAPGLPEVPCDMTEAFVLAYMATMDGQRLCLAVAFRQFIRAVRNSIFPNPNRKNK